MCLAPEHREDLYKSNLTDSTNEACQIHSVPPHKVPYKDVESACAYPYFTLDGKLSGYERWKLFPPHITKDGDEQKYYQAKDSRPELYLPPIVMVDHVPTSWEKIAPDPSISLIGTEGEKKTLAACQIGLTCFGVTGVWGWKQRLDQHESMVLPSIEAFVWEGRKVELVPDSDVWRKEKFNALCGFYALAQELKELGALITFVQLPEHAS